MNTRELEPTPRLHAPVSRRSFVAAASLAGALALVSRSAWADQGGRSISELLGGLASGQPEPSGQPAASAVSAPARPMLLSGLETADPRFEVAPSSVAIAEDLGNVVNLADMYLLDPQLDMLRREGFFVMREGGNEFFDVYEENRYNLFPNLVTVDSMMHTYHLYFSHLMKNVERDHLVWLLQHMSSALFDQSCMQLDSLRGTEWESAAARNVAFFCVGSRLLGLLSPVADDIAAVVEAELANISAAGGIGMSELIGDYEDYSQYIVRGYYEGDVSLEGYFRAMMWYGRLNFRQSVEDLDRSALLMVLALSASEAALASWSTIYTVTSFFAGTSDDCGYYEYRPLVDRSYGEAASVSDLPGNDACWQAFLALLAETPAPRINSVPVEDTGTDDDHVAENKGYRFMGQRFSIDESIFQNLCYNKVAENPDGIKRKLPDALDIPAAFGSDVALEILEQRGATAFGGYSEMMGRMRSGVEGVPDSFWTCSLYSQWLHTLDPLLDEKGDEFPAFMQGRQWALKDLATFLGSYTELKHDTVLYAKQMMAEAGGYIEERDDRGYVEPEAVVYARLAALTDATAIGLDGFGLLSGDDAYNLGLLAELSRALEAISEKELRGEGLTDDEYELIRSFGAQLEHFWQEVYKEDAEGEEYFTSRQFPAAVVTDVATDPDGRVLELGTGRVSRLYALVPVDGSLRVAIGPVYSFYQFVQPIDQRLTDTEWRRMLGIELADDGSWIEQSPDVVPDDWTLGFSLSWADLQ